MIDQKLKALGLDSLPMGIASIYLVSLVIVLAVVVTRSKTMSDRLGRSLVAVIGFALVPYLLFFYRSPEQKKYDEDMKEIFAKQEVARPIFEKLCAEAKRPNIRRTVEDVEGILLIKVRPPDSMPRHEAIRNRDWERAALPRERTEASGFAELFLLDRRWQTENSSEVFGTLGTVGKQAKHGFQFVDVLSPDGKSRTRITAIEDPSYREDPVPGVRFLRKDTTDKSPQFAVTFEDNLDPELRKHWIAGTSIRVLDLKTNEVIAEQSFWSWDNGFGFTTQSSSPWLRARQCPTIVAGQAVARYFVDTVLHAKQRKDNRGH